MGLSANQYYVLIHADGFAGQAQHDLETIIRAINGGQNEMHMEGIPDGEGESTEQTPAQWVSAAEAAIAAINKMIADHGHLIPEHEWPKIHATKNALIAFRDNQASMSPQQRVASIQAAIAAIRTLAAIPGLAVAAVALVNGILILAVGIALADLVLQAARIVANCGADGAVKLAQASAYLLGGVHSGNAESVAALVEELIDCASGNGGGDGLTQAQMAGIFSGEGASAAWNAPWMDQGGHAEEQTDPCPTCSMNPCTCFPIYQ